MEHEIGPSKSLAEHKIKGTYLFGSINENTYIKHTDGQRNKYFF